MADLLRAAQVRAWVAVGAPVCRMDGGQLELIWQPLRPGWRLLLRCPVCRRRNCRQLERPPGLWWRCCRCRFRTPEGDERARRRKLRRARRARLAARRAADGTPQA